MKKTLQSGFLSPKLLKIEKKFQLIWNFQKILVQNHTRFDNKILKIKNIFEGLEIFHPLKTQ
jgi:hypothetical protein